MDRGPKKKPEGRPYDGVKAVAEMMEHLGTEEREKLLANVGVRDPEIAEKIRRSVFGFENLLKVDVAGIRLLLTEVPRPQWIMALRKVDDALLKHVYSAMSARAREILEEEMTDLGPQRVTDVQAAQEFIAETARKLLAAGKIQTVK